MITLEQAKRLTYHQTIYEVGAYNAGGTAKRWRVNGKVKTWKRSPDRVQVPLKHGLYSYGYLTEENLEWFVLSEED